MKNWQTIFACVHAWGNMKKVTSTWHYVSALFVHSLCIILVRQAHVRDVGIHIVWALWDITKYEAMYDVILPLPWQSKTEPVHVIVINVPTTTT